MVELEPDQVVGGLDRSVEVEADRVAPDDLFQPPYVMDRRLRMGLLAIAGRERLPIPPQQREAALLALGLDQHVPAKVRPGEAGGRELLLDLLAGDFRALHWPRAVVEVYAGVGAFPDPRSAR